MFRLSLFLFFYVLFCNSFSQSPPTCSDGILNGLEVDIDCGGECDACSDGLESGQIITVEDGMGYQYRHALWLPAGYDENNPHRKFPLIVNFHGNSGNLSNTTQAQAFGPMNYRNESWWNYPFIIVNPVRGGGIVPADEFHSFILQIIDNYHVDSDRIYITGTSGGSFNIAFYLKEYPDFIAAVVSAGGYSHEPNIGSTVLCEEYKGTPMWYFHNDGDQIVVFSYQTIEDLVMLHTDCGEPAPDPYTFYSIFDSDGHNSWNRVFNPFLNSGNTTTYASQYNLSDLSGLSTEDNYNDYQTPFGLPNNVPTIYDWLLSYENLPNSCRNMVQDGDETGVDCGGSCKPCTSTYACHNGVLDDGETAIDCGGDCPTCERTLIWDNGTWNADTDPLQSDVTIIRENYTGSFSSKTLYIEPGVVFTVSGTLEVMEDLENEGTLIVPSGASLITYESMEVSSNIVFQKETRFPDYRYSLVGSPIEQSNENVASDLGDLVYTFDESLNNWTLTSSNEELVPAVGYTQANQSLLELTGKPNAGAITHIGSNDNMGWNLISNPYPAAIEIDAFIDGNPNITGSIYLWDDSGTSVSSGNSNDYIVANKMGIIDVNGVDNTSRWNGHINSFQAFFVQLTGDDEEIYFTEDMRVSDQNAEDNFFREAATESIITITLEKNDLSMRTMVGFVDEALGDDLIFGFDAFVFDENSEDGIYTIKKDHQLAVQAVSTDASGEIPIGFSLSSAGTAKINIELSSIDDAYLLIDKVANTSLIIDQDQQSYEFIATEGKINDRFSLASSSAILGVGDQLITFFTHKKTLYFNVDNEIDPVTIKLFDLNGNALNLKASKSTTFDLSHLPSGVYIISDGQNRSKVLLHD